ncbi:alpha-amylase family glycosyl hydrolase [Limibacter armeniacum]|uniref:alpha-amylase family glycosyl hydrolase n=1 Tax=Limibacter armeniacum TaxID=466084 RepID=UPI002FE52F9C
MNKLTMSVGALVLSFGLMSGSLHATTPVSADNTTISVSELKKNTTAIDKIEPAFWWAGMKNTSVMLMVHGQNIGNSKVSVDYPGVKVVEAVTKDNPNYLFLTLDLKGAQPGKVLLKFDTGKRKPLTYEYELKAKSNDPGKAQGLDAGDVMYLIMPDRFVNGNPDNDTVKEMKQAADRDFRGGRHGGDIEGVISKLDYLQELGITTVWLTPFLENNEPEWSYHGYAITNFYKADPRHGTNEDYKRLVDEAHKRGMKVVMDLVFNHIGDKHWWMADLPTEDWVHQWDTFTRSNFKGEVISDPNASEYDKTIMEKGWFDGHMPDLNNSNPYLAKYLIQMSEWWIEYTGIDGIRMDTYPYNDKETMSEWVKTVKEEYPDFYIVGETWLWGTVYESYWKKGRPNPDGYVTNLESISDFPIWDAINKVWRDNRSVHELHTALTQDFLYENPIQNKIFMDNHDVDRAFGSFNKDLESMKMATAFLLTTRGIPQIFYGTEVLMANRGDHGDIREDFPEGGMETSVMLLQLKDVLPMKTSITITLKIS